MGVEWRITVLSGSRARDLSTQQFTVIRGGYEGLPWAAAQWHVSIQIYKKKKRKSGTRPNRHFKSPIIHLDGNYISTEGHHALFCCSHCTYVIDNSLRHGLESQNRKDILFRKGWFKLSPSKVWQGSSRVLLLQRSQLKCPDRFNTRLTNCIVFSEIQYRCLFLRRPKVYLLVEAAFHISYRLINPKWDSAEVALDSDWILSTESSFWFSSQSILQGVPLIG